MFIPPNGNASSWLLPNYTDPETRGPAKEIITLCLLALATVVLGIRIYTRRFISHGFGLDDSLICLAYIPAAAFAVSGIVADYRFGWNRHIWDVSPSVISAGIKLSLASQILFVVSLSLTKLSMVALMYRLASAGESRLRFVAISLATLITLSAVIFVIVVVFQCRPVSAYWSLSFQHRECINEAAHLLAAGAISIATDFVVVLLPISAVWNLQLPVRQQIIIVLLFAAGFLATAAGIVRTILTWQMNNAHDLDITWRAWGVWIASSVELFVGILCASLPATKPFFIQYLPSILGSIPTRMQRSMKDSKACASDTDESQARSPDQSWVRYSATYDSKSGQDSQVPPASYTMPSPTVSARSIDLNKPLPAIFDQEAESSIVSLGPSASSTAIEDWNSSDQSMTALSPPKK